MSTTAPPRPTGRTPQAAHGYHLLHRLDVRGRVERWAGEDDDGKPIVVVSESLPASTEWPGTGWEEQLRARTGGKGLAAIRERYVDGNGRVNLVCDAAPRATLWDVWDDPGAGPEVKFGTLGRLAELLRALHQAGAVLEGLRPEQVRICPDGRLAIDPTVVLLPLSTFMASDVRPSAVSPPELHDGLPADARSDLYCFGTVLYALELGHELSELDFAGPGDPLPFADRFPEAHPLLARLVGKTLARLREHRFPSAQSDDLTGFDELIAALSEARRFLGRVRLDVAAWTSTGMIRADNEDAVAVVHAAESRRGVNEEWALVLAADGMGGSAAGEVAAAMTVQSLRRKLLKDSPLRSITDEPNQERQAIRRGTISRQFVDALKEANRQVHRAAREGIARRGMGCTAEAVYLDGRQIVVGHVGDSRTYRLHRGVLTQLTRDHTLVGRLVELGKLTTAQAETHPRRNELRQAIGCRGDVRPDVACAPLVAGDWVVVCTDGLTGCVRPADIQQVLEQSRSADAAARRLVNRANRLGAADNVSVVVVRAT
jgi:serine/threonine protein phosphatase PrpC